MPTVFVSYSWDTAGHKAWVRRFGEDLRTRGITVWLDQFELRLGDDVTSFMERGVTQADFVVLVCTENFGQKATQRRGGVGYEQAIVTSEILQATPGSRALRLPVKARDAVSGHTRLHAISPLA